MAINPLIALQTTAADVGSSLDRRENRLSAEARREALKERNELLKNQDERAEEEAARVREQERLQSIATGALEIEPLLREGKRDEAIRALSRRRGDLVERGLPTMDTDEAFAMLAQGQDEELLSSLQSAIDVGERRGLIQPAQLSKTPSGLQEFVGKAGLANLNEKEVREALMVEFGLKPRAGESAQERIARNAELASLVAATQAEIAEAKTEATETTKARVQKAVTQRGAANKLGDARTLYDRLRGANLDLIYGRGESLYPDILRSQQGIDLLADRDQLVSMLKLGARGELKGQGPITEGEQGILSQAVTTLGNPNISPEKAREDLDAAMGILFRNAGEEFTPDEIPTVTTQAEFDALPSGALFIEDGVQYRKP